MRLRNGKTTEEIIDKHLKHQPISFPEKNRFFGETWKTICKECQREWPCNSYKDNADAMHYALKELVDEIEYKQRVREQSQTERDLLNSALGGIYNIVRVYYRDDGSELRLVEEDFTDYDM